ncbi:hypothetical protein B0H13DRAFT_1882067 [Mycena leptocephala]|nr:hypothetical protein B0H13DRAFT_1882067 [Mycena leptocephala]
MCSSWDLESGYGVHGLQNPEKLAWERHMSTWIMPIQIHVWPARPLGDLRSWGYEARVFTEDDSDGDDSGLHANSDDVVELALAAKEWYSIPGDRLPESWSDGRVTGRAWGHQAELQKLYGIAGLIPVMFFPYPQDRGPMVLCADRIHYLFNHDYEDWLMRFDGRFTSAEDFIENGDWNRLGADWQRRILITQR